jgi:predicted transcriptional regulator
VINSNKVGTVEAAEINFRLSKLGYKQSDVAIELKCSQSLVSNVIHNRSSSYSVAKFIATLISEPVEELFPGRYVFKPRK